MAQMIQAGREMIRINPAKNSIEYSPNDGRTWSSRCTSFMYGLFIDLLLYGTEIFAVTSKGIYCSTNDGRTWSSRCTSSMYGEFQSLMDSGRELLAQTSKGLYCSTNGGRAWSKRH